VNTYASLLVVVVVVVVVVLVQPLVSGGPAGAIAVQEPRPAASAALR
jgi:preprotein translocase subunit SecG